MPTFAPGETTKTITIEVKRDNKKESTEYFYLDLFDNSSNALFTKNRGLGTILYLGCGSRRVPSGSERSLLMQNGRSGGRAQRNKHGALLRGLLRCRACNCAMSHSFSSKGKRRYRYYVCQQAQKNGWQACPSPSVPAGEIERVVIDEIKCIGRAPALIKASWADVRREAEGQIDRLKSERTALADNLRADHAELGMLAGKSPPAGDTRLANLGDRIRS